jgi:hypothetical protein
MMHLCRRTQSESFKKEQTERTKLIIIYNEYVCVCIAPGVKKVCFILKCVY